MNSPYNIFLLIGGGLSAIAAVLHIGIILGGPSWYRFFGAGESMAAAAQAGRSYPAIVTFCIALVLAAWSAYAFSGAGLLARLPFLKLALALITIVYLLRGLAIVPLISIAKVSPTPFLVWSSLICLVYGLVHVIGLMQVWRTT
jgi:hypothetical protein